MTRKIHQVNGRRYKTEFETSVLPMAYNVFSLSKIKESLVLVEPAPHAIELGSCATILFASDSADEIYEFRKKSRLINSVVIERNNGKWQLMDAARFMSRAQKAVNKLSILDQIERSLA